jgi:hypothetical protein
MQIVAENAETATQMPRVQFSKAELRPFKTTKARYCKLAELVYFQGNSSWIVNLPEAVLRFAISRLTKNARKFLFLTKR